MLDTNSFVKIHLQKLDDYINAIIDDRIICNKYERLAVDRFLAHKQKYIYKENEVIKALRFFSILKIQINNQPAQAEIMDFQMLWLASIVGLYRTDTQLLYSQSFILVAKKNSKSVFGTLLALYCCLDRNILNSHVIMVAASRDQAKTLIGYCDFIIKNSEPLTDLFKVNKNINLKQVIQFN